MPETYMRLVDILVRIVHTRPVFHLRIRRRLDRIEGMVRNGDRQARYHLENLMDELQSVQELTGDKVSRWLGPAMDRMREARDQIAEDAPEAARKLRSLAADLELGPSEPRTEPTPATPPAGDEP